MPRNQAAETVAEVAMHNALNEAIHEARVGLVQSLFAQLTEEERMTFLHRYCHYCGVELDALSTGVCHCMNDE